MRGAPVAAVLLVVLTLAAVTGQSETRYEFDHVEAEYAAVFTVWPAQEDQHDWATDVAGGPGLPLEATYGVVRFWNDGDDQQGREEFLRLQGLNGSVRFLINSMAAEYETNSTAPSALRSFFWSAKQVEDGAVVKNFTPPIRSAELLRLFDQDGDVQTVELATSDDGEDANQRFWDGFAQANRWTTRPGFFEDAGLPTASLEVPV